MEEGIKFAIIVVFIAFFPAWFLLVCLIPILIIISNYMGIISPAFVIGEAKVQFYDLMLILIAVRVILSLILQRTPIHLAHIQYRVILFFGVLLFATLLGLRFGIDIFRTELFSLIRYFLFGSVFFLLFYSVRTTRTLVVVDKAFWYVCYSIGFSVYMSIAFYAVGITFGEIQDSDSHIRYFGPLGDQVAFILVLIFLKGLLDGRIILPLIWFGAILATGTRGAIISLMLGSFIFLFMHSEKVKPRTRLIALTVIFGIFLALFFTDLGSTTLSRFTSSEILSTGFDLRMISMTLGAKVFLENIFFGVGFNGFHLVALGYNPMELPPDFSDVLISNTSNQFLQVSSDAGIFGIASFFAFMFSSIKLYNLAFTLADLRLKNSLAAGKIWLITLLIGNQTAVWLLAGSMISYFFWIHLGLALIVSQQRSIVNSYTLRR